MKNKKREEEAEILAQMEEAIRKETLPEMESSSKRVGIFKDKTPETWHCHKCGVMMENGKCPQCGHTVYVPMDDKKKKIIRWTIGGVCLAVALVVFILTR